MIAEPERPSDADFAAHVRVERYWAELTHWLDLHDGRFEVIHTGDQLIARTRTGEVNIDVDDADMLKLLGFTPVIEGVEVVGLSKVFDAHGPVVDP